MHINSRTNTMMILRTCSFLLLLTAFTSTAHAQPINVFSFSGRTWTPGGSLSQTYSGVAGGNISFNISGSTGNLNNYSGTQTPNIFTDTFGGLGINNSVMILAMDQNNNTNQVTNRITFSHTNGVRNVSFTIFDIDRGSTGGSNYQDQVTVTAWRSGSVLSSSLVTITAHGASNTAVGNVATGTASVADTGTGSGLGNATFQVSAFTIIDRIDIVYTNGPLAPNNPTQQWIMLSDIAFIVAVPEVSTVFLLIGTPVLLGSIWYLRNRKKLESKGEQPAVVAEVGAGEGEVVAV